MTNREESPAFRPGEDVNGTTILGNSTQTEILEQVQIQTVKVLVTLTSHDNENLLISQMAHAIYQMSVVRCGLEDPC